jgi:mono/diheme cytochrome c family protein
MSKRTRVITVVVLLALGAAVLYGWMIIRRGFGAREQPSAVEEFLAHTARSLATPAAMEDLRNPQPATPENLREGMEHFADHCAVCHANNGSGDTSFGRGMYPKPPDMRAGHTQNLTDGEIYSIIQNGIRLTGMPAFGQPGRTDDTGSWNLVLFIRHLPKLTPEEEREMQAMNPKTAAEWREQQEIEDFLGGDDGKPSSPPHPELKNHQH